MRSKKPPLPSSPSQASENNLIVLIIPLRYVREYITIDFVGGGLIFVIVRNLTLTNWIAFISSYMSSILIRLALLGYRRLRKAQIHVLPIASLSRLPHGAPRLTIEKTEL